MRFNSKHAAMEMTVGTMVTIVLLVVVLVLGLVLVRTVFRSGTDAINQIDSSVQDEIKKLFAEEGKSLVVYPSSRQINLNKGDDPSGFAFSVENKNLENRLFTYNVEADPNFDFNKCGSSFTAATANSWMIISSGSFDLRGGARTEIPELILFNIPETAPTCTIPYKLDVESGGDPYSGTKVFVTIK